MKKSKYILSLTLLVCIFYSSYASDTLQFYPILNKTAYSLKAKHWNKGFWEPLSYGLNNRIEIQSYPLLLPIMPNLGFKISYPKIGNDKFCFSSNHSVTYYTPWLKFWQSTGTGGIITPQISIPTQLLIENGVSISYLINPKHIITHNLNLNFVWGQKISSVYTVDLPIIYPRFAPAFIEPVISFKTNFQGKIYWRFQYLTSADYFYVNGPEFNNFIENKWLLAYAKTNKLKLLGGAIITYGQYPFGNQTNIIPYMNVVYTIGRK
jgi:hypothetical protein